MRNKKILAMALATLMMGTLAFTGCSNSNEKKNDVKETTAQTDGDAKEPSQTTDDVANNTNTDIFTSYDQNATWDDTATAIELSEEDVVIEEEGTYVLSGTLKNGRVYVNVGSQDKVQLVLNGVDITCEDSAAIYVENADKVSVTLAEGTENVLTDGGDAETTDADGCIYSKDDLSINGTGTLVVNGKVSNGIDCNNDIKIVSGNITVKAVNNGIKAKESISVKDGKVIVEAEDAIKASSNSDNTIGTFHMEGGELELTATDDGISATIDITVNGGSISVDAGDKVTNCDGKETIAEGCLVQ